MVNAERLKEAIERKSMSVAQVAEAIGIDRSTFYRKVNESTFTVHQAKCLMEVLNLSGEEFDAIFFGTESQVCDRG